MQPMIGASNPYQRVFMKWISVLFLTGLSLNAFACDFPKIEVLGGGCICPSNMATSPLGFCITSPSVVVDPALTIVLPEPLTAVPIADAPVDAQVDVPVTVPVADQGATAVAPTPSPTVSTQEGPDTFASYNPATCVWAADLPRKLHTAPGCTRSTTNQICVGYVVCDDKAGTGKFVRTATCGGDKCGSSPVACVNDRSFYSRPPEENVGKYMSDRVKTQVIGQ